MSKTKIEWSDKTWNPITGCTKISHGCQNCYAERMAHRLQATGQNKYENGFKVTCHPEALDEPLKWKKPSRIFVCSMGDLFHDNVPFSFIASIFAVMATSHQHTFLVLTKRPERMKQFFEWLKEISVGANDRYISSDSYQLGVKARQKLRDDGKVSMDEPPLPTEIVRALYDIGKPLVNERLGEPSRIQRMRSIDERHWRKWPLSNVWLGVTAENQDQSDKRIPILLQIPAAKRFVSVEPMLGPVNIRGYLMQGERPALCTCGHGHGFNRCPNYGRVTETCHHKECDCKKFKRVNFELDWIICGGESGPGARPMHPDWVRGLRDQCQAAGTPFLFKQQGEWSWDLSSYNGPKLPPERVHWLWPDGTYKQVGCGEVSPGKVMTYKVGKKQAGRLLDGREWDEYPGTNFKEEQL